MVFEHLINDSNLIRHRDKTDYKARGEYGTCALMFDTCFTQTVNMQQSDLYDGATDIYGKRKAWRTLGFLLSDREVMRKKVFLRALNCVLNTLRVNIFYSFVYILIQRISL